MLNLCKQLESESQIDIASRAAFHEFNIIENNFPSEELAKEIEDQKYKGAEVKWS